ncbi:SET domain-containing protein, partial [Hysterangium stoloniferum]
YRSSIGAASPWHEYFLSLPRGRVDIAVFWGADGDRDGMEALKWTQGTEIQSILSPYSQLALRERINEYFENIACPMLQQLQLSYVLKDFHRAYSLVSSRAFIVDAYLGLSLVPVADAFNHIENNHVHLQSDYHVCSACGSLDECDHDLEYADSSLALITSIPDTCEMVANSPIGPSEEVFNTYGDRLTNAQLLCQYGFLLDGNENNVITWTTKQLLDGTAKPEGTFSVWGKLASRWPHHCGWDRCQLVYNTESRVVDDDGTLIQNRAMHTLLELNADGQISHQLWLLVFTTVLPKVDDTIDDMISLAKQVAQMQERLEASLASGDSADDSGPSTADFECRAPDAAISFVQQIAERIMQICRRKIESAHSAEVSASALGDILDGLSHERKLTRLAISYALEERATLQSCQSAWTEMVDLCSELCN